MPSETTTCDVCEKPLDWWEVYLKGDLKLCEVCYTVDVEVGVILEAKDSDD